MRKIAVMDTRTIVIGRVGENDAAQVVWPGLLSRWRGLYGEGTVQLAVRRALDKSPYPAVCTVDGDDVTWTVSAADTAQHGTGECELSYLVGDVVVKSQTWATLTLRSLTGEEPGEPPEPQKSWVDQVISAGATAEKAATAAATSASEAQDAAAHQPTIKNGTWWTWNADAGEYEDTGTAATGPAGKADISLGVSGAETGQIPQVKEIGEGGSPTAWKTGLIDLAFGDDGLLHITIDGAVIGSGVDVGTKPDTPIDLFDVSWSNYAITCGQNTNNYNAWAPHNLQYDDTRDAYIFLQCHCNRHLNATFTTWTLSRIYPDESWKVEDLGLPNVNKLGALWVEDGTWYVLTSGSNVGYKSSDGGETWTQFATNLTASIWGIYKCGDVYYMGSDAVSDTYYTSKNLVEWETHTFGFSAQYTSLMEASFCQFSGYTWAFLRTNDATLGHPVILKSLDGINWELVSDGLLHSYRSDVSCLTTRDYIVLADIDRDAGILYYSKFDGETVEVLNQWSVGEGGDDFHCPCLCSNGVDTIIIEYMLHSWTYTGSFSDVQQYNCENMMLVGKKDAAMLNFVAFTDINIPNDSAEEYIAENFDVYPANVELSYFKTIVMMSESGYNAALVYKTPEMFAAGFEEAASAALYNGNTLVALYNSEDPSRFGPDAVRAPTFYSALLTIHDKLYVYRYIEGALPAIQHRTVMKEVTYTPNTNNLQISGVLEATSNLGLTKQIPLFKGAGATNYQMRNHKKIEFIEAVT